MKKYFILSFSFFLVGTIQLFAGKSNFSGSVESVGSSKPIKDYEIQIVGTHRRIHVADLDGRFGFADLEPGEYLVSVVAEGFEKFVISIPIPDEKEVRYKFSLAKAESKEKPRSAFLGEYSLSGFGTDYTPDLLRSIPQDPERPMQSINELNPYYLFRKNLVGELSYMLTTDVYFSGTNFSSPFSGLFSVQSPTPSASGLAEVNETAMYSHPAERNEPWAMEMEPNRGKDNGFDMFFKVGFGLPSLNGSMHNDLRLAQSSDGLNLETVDGGPKLLGRGEFTFEYGISGELPGAEKGSTFALSVRNYSQDHNYGLDVYDPAGNNYGAMPGQSSMIRNVNTNFKIVLDPRTRVYADAMFAATTKENSSNYWLYATGKQTVQTGKTTAIERQMKQNAENIQYDRIAAAIEFDIPSAFRLRIGFARNGYEYKYGRRSNGDDPNWANGYDMYQPTDRYSSGYFNGADSLIQGGNRILDNYERLYKPDTSVDHYILSQTPKVNPLTGFAEYDRYDCTDNPYGFDNELLSSEFDPRAEQQYWTSQDGVQYEKMEKYTANVSISKQFELLKMKNDLSLDFDFSYSILKRFSVANPYRFIDRSDIYTDEFDFESYNADLLAQKENRNPIQWDLTLADRIAFGQWTFAPAVKATFFNPGFKKYLNMGYIKNKNSTDFALSPSLIVTFRPSDYTCFTVTAASYNEPLPYNTYLAEALEEIIGRPSLGLKNSKHIAFSIDQGIFDNLSIRASVFKNWQQALGTKYIKEIPDPYYAYLLSSENDRKTFVANFQLFYKLNNNWSINATASYLRNDEANSFADHEQFTYNAIVSYSLGRFEGPSIGEFFPLAGMNFSLVGKVQPGQMYCHVDEKGSVIGNAVLYQCANTYSIDMRISKMFFFADLFPSLSGGSGIEIALDVINLFDLTKPLRYNQATNDPDETINFHTPPVSAVGTSTYFKTADYRNPETFAADQYDCFGRRKYNSAADFDHDGRVTIDERYKAYINYYETELRQRVNYQLPRRVFMSVTLKF